MSESKDLSGLYGRGILAVAVLAAVAAAGYFSGYWLGSEPDDSVPLTVAEPDGTAVELPSTESDPAEADTAASETAPDATPETEPSSGERTTSVTAALSMRTAPSCRAA